jgi:hypothetical protein
MEEDNKTTITNQDKLSIGHSSQNYLSADQTFLSRSDNQSFASYPVARLASQKSWSVTGE